MVTRKQSLMLAGALICVPCVTFPSLALADGNFGRDRNQAVSERPQEEYQASGLHWGSFIASPALDVGVESNDNIFYAPTAKIGDTILSTAPSLNLASNWNRHALQVKVAADYSSYAKHTSENTLALNGGLGGRIDVHGNSNIFGGIDVSQNYEPRFDPSSPKSIASPIRYNALGSKLGFVAEGNRLRFEGTATSQKLTYHAVKLLTGGTSNQSFRNFTGTDATGRFDYALSPAVSLYGTYTVNRRRYEDKSVGRDSDGTEYGVGASFDITHLMRGELQAGSLEQTYKSPLYKPTKGNLVKGTVEYFPTELTTLTFTTGKRVEESPAIGAASFLSGSNKISVDHELRRNVVLSATYEGINDSYNGIDRHDKRSGVTLGARYLLSRTVYLRAGYSYLDLKSRGTAAITNYKDNSLRLSVGLQY